MRREQPPVAQNRPATLRFILHNLAWMVGSLALAILVWYAAVSAQNPVEQRRFPGRVPIKVLTDEGMLVVSDAPQTALVTIRAPRTVWDVLEASEIEVEADLGKLEAGRHTVQTRGYLLDGRQGVV